MTREQAKKWLPEITHWANGGNLWYWYDNKEWVKIDNIYFETLDDIKIVIEDKHFEARKAFALGEPIEISLFNDEPFERCENPIWNDIHKYRPKPKQWYDTVSKENPVLCHFWDTPSIKHAGHIVGYKNNMFLYRDGYWRYAEPVKPEECWKEIK